MPLVLVMMMTMMMMAMMMMMMIMMTSMATLMFVMMMTIMMMMMMMVIITMVHTHGINIHIIHNIHRIFIHLGLFPSASFHADFFFSIPVSFPFFFPPLPFPLVV